ncbi:hypothetical protein SGQ83_11335 [Flavobacterium sp. Fl-318]|uniref:Uncharacterized protein n=1 Tax=Flavobacterium cupriresistens TaxID=2893885 RepID=A0ABU4RBI6_9FLAO|nr:MULTISPECIES: hypothetical protein [unclassified Flavobacterium]MDX6189944.1 hypothetical protein [Flavobacterium sp. Fl-318]UFH42769.1 hypothetical protein LNP23_00785 [Flavobacterium sp. F-323]
MILILTASCQNDIENENKEEALSLHNNYEIVDGIIKIESVQKLKNILKTYQNDVQAQNDFNDEIRQIQTKGFKSLTPMFDEDDVKKMEDFIVAKKAKKQKMNSEYGISNDVSGDENFDVEDDLIQDPSFAAILNENRELIVGDSLYKYTEQGLYFCLEKNRQKLYNYLNGLKSSSKKNNLTRKMAMVAPVDEEISFFIPEDRPFLEVPLPDIPVQDPFPVKPTPRLMKSSLPISRVDNDGFFEKIFGESEVDTEEYGDGRRIKIKFWNQNYFIFSSLGCSARFQKRVKILGVSGWQKSYATQIELGVNDISYEYNYNVPVYNVAKYNYENFFIEINGVKYAGSGKQIIEFPSGATNFPYSGSSPQEVTVSIFRQDLFEIKCDANKVYNQVVDVAVKQAFKAIVAQNPALTEVGKKVENGDLTYKVVAVNPLLNKATISTQGMKWTNNNDNAITHYFDFNFVLTYSSDYNNPEDYLKGLQGSTKYARVRADIYGAALHDNVWKGRRLILGQ